VRPLDWTGDPPGVSSERNLVALRSLLVAHLAVQSWAWALRPLPPLFAFPTAAIFAAAVLLTGALAASLVGYGRAACAAALAVGALELAWLFPFAANHTHLAVVCVGFCAALDPGRPDDRDLLIRGLRWATVIVFFYAGLQKVLHGLYFRGEFLAWMVGQGAENWTRVFGWMLPADEIARLQGYARYQVGAGPYRVSSPLFVLLSNAVWVAEMALAALLIPLRTRAAAALGAIALVLTIQSAPREFMFALLYGQLLLLFVPGHWNHRLLAVFLLAYGSLLAVLLGAPGGFLLKADGNL
jgi:hypothetical protein